MHSEVPPCIAKDGGLKTYEAVTAICSCQGAQSNTLLSTDVLAQYYTADQAQSDGQDHCDPDSASLISPECTSDAACGSRTS